MELVEEELDSRLAIVQVAEFKSQRKEECLNWNLC